MKVDETIKNIRASCDNYVDPNLFAFIIDDDNYMGTNNILEVKGYGIQSDDSYEDRLLKIHKSENIFIPVGVMVFIPILNECDLLCEKDYHFELTAEEFNSYADEEEKLFGILIKKDSNEYLIGKTDTCSCSIDSSFEEFEKKDSEFYKKIEEIIDNKIIY